ncbi:MAG: HAD family phosphatase [Acidobacteriota bacterium]
MTLGSELRWDGLLFDFDGVLADTEHVHHASWNAVLQPFGIQFDWPEYQKQCIGIADRMVAQRLQLPDPDEIVARKQSIFRQALEQSPPFLEPTRALLSKISSVFKKMAVVSSSYRQEVEPPLERSGLRTYFQLVVCGNDVKNLKPWPDPYLLAADRLGVRNPLVIEDSEAGIASGRAAGFEVFEVKSVVTMATDLDAYLTASGFAQ